MLVNRQNLGLIFTGYKTAFQAGLGMADSSWEQFATVVPSTTSEEQYGWLKSMPGVREWLGDRVIHNLAASDYRIKNKDFELSYGVDRNDIEDDSYGIYSMSFQEMGRSVAAHPNELVWGLAKAGFTTACYDGQNFFDTDHPVLDANGNEISVANTDGGAGAPWFLADDSRVLKPIIFQRRKAFDFVAMDQATDEQVFQNKKFRYGTHGRHNVGFGFWQTTWGSRQALDATAYENARVALVGMKGDYGRPLGLMPKKLVVGPSNEKAAKLIVGSKELPGGGDNPWYGTAEVLVVPWLAE